MSDVWAPGIEDEERAFRRGDHDLPMDTPSRREFEDDEGSDTPDDCPW